MENKKNENNLLAKIKLITALNSDEWKSLFLRDKWDAFKYAYQIVESDICNAYARSDSAITEVILDFTDEFQRVRSAMDKLRDFFDTCWILEYNPDEGRIHLNAGDSFENTNGYKTICIITERHHSVFEAALKKLFDFERIDGSQVGDKFARPTVETLRSLWQLYRTIANDPETKSEQLYDKFLKAALNALKTQSL